MLVCLVESDATVSSYLEVSGRETSPAAVNNDTSAGLACSVRLNFLLYVSYVREFSSVLHFLCVAMCFPVLSELRLGNMNTSCISLTL